MNNICLICLSCLLIFSCTKETNTRYNQIFELSECKKIDSENIGFAKMKLTIRNNSSISSDCWVSIKIKKNNTIIEHAEIGYSILNPGESQVKEAWFSEFDKHSEYSKAEVILYWEVDNISYSKTYTF